MNTRRVAWWGLLPVLLLALSVTSCGGASGGPGPDGGGQGLVLLTFSHEGIDNVALNERLSFQFSEQLSVASVTTSSIQIRKGPDFGQAATGDFRIEGSKVIFEPMLAGMCDLSAGGLIPQARYRIQLIGHPEEFALRNTVGQPLAQTSTHEFETRSDTDPERFIDQIPAFGPSVVTADSTPSNGDQAVSVNDANQVVLTMTENLDPCTVDLDSVQLHMYETGNPTLAQSLTAPNGNKSGLYSSGSTADADPSANSWGADSFTPWAPAQRIPSSINVQQDFDRTQLLIRPLSGRFPENALIVVRLTSDIQDYGGQPLSPFTMSFTTENLDRQTASYAMLVEGETPFDTGASTADINTERAPGIVQAYLLFAGDGDNGGPTEQLTPGGPEAEPTCTLDRQANDGTLDDFNPDVDVVFNTGATENTCPNSVDGSTAVVFEFATFRIRSGVTVRVDGVNPIIILVQGDILIEAGARLLVRGDGAQGVPQGRGKTGYAWKYRATAADVRKGGVGVAGGGDGGASSQYNQTTETSGKDGESAFGSADGLGTVGGEGAGKGGTHHDTIYPTSPGTAQGGGGGGHGDVGVTATNVLGPTHTNQGPTQGEGGAAYPLTDTMAQPSAGGGGGGGGNEEWAANYKGNYSTGGGSGGAGGGFLDLTSAGNISVYGVIDAAGSNGGSGGSSNYQAGPGGGGGGAGGGIRLITSGDILLGATTVITAAGGAGGNSPNGNSGGGGPQNHGGAGGDGRVVFEDSDSIVSGMGLADVTPAEGSPGFFRGRFDPTRFQGGGTMPSALTGLIQMGPLNPDFVLPVSADFVAAIPAGTSNGFGKTSVFIEARGYEMLADGTPAATASPWRTVGYFKDSGVEAAPEWVEGLNPTDGAAIPSDNMNGNLQSLDGFEFLQIRMTFYLPATAGPFDPGPSLDDWTIRFSSDQ